MLSIVQLKKYLYGLLQASEYFGYLISLRLLAMWFTRFVSDYELFILSRGEEQEILSKHIDDYLLAATRGSELLKFVYQKFQKSFSDHFYPANTRRGSHYLQR